MDALEAYLVELSANRLAGAVPETSGYGALATLLNEVGRHLKPKVRCVINPANRGAGIPDGGFFVASQFEKGAADPLPGQLPARGALEVKPVGDDVHAVAGGEQVRRYLEKYRQVLVTTYREFVLVGHGAEGEPRLLESYALSETELGFWSLAASPRKAATQHGERLGEFLKRCLLRQAQIASPQDLAWFLASYAREARARTEERDLPALATTRSALEEALGMSFSGEKGEHFFRSTLVQTLFYGLFAAWVFWAEHHPHTDTGVRFDWRSAARYLHIPILQKLFYDFANPAQLGALKLDEVLDWAAEALNRVDRASFFSSFEQSHAVQYFYEPFLEAFDPELRKALGVWYTPPEIVTYMVERVDQVLRSELGIADGLADPRVVVLDPCCGTGAYLVEVLNRIASTLRERGDDALLAHDLKEAAKSRVYGFEILPAPFVISHLQIGMLLHRLGAPLSDDSDERAGVYLTNALTGWEPPTEPKQHLLFTEMEEERDKAEAVKQHAPILVILGNPPYNGFAGVSPEEEGGLLDAYKAGLAEWGVTKHSLDDLYVRFFRIAERRIAEEGKRGVVCFISNDSWTAGPSYVTAREHLLASFDKFWIENMHGDRTQSEYAPDGRTSETVFALPGFSPGIRQGVAISLWVKSGRDEAITEVRFRDDLDDADAGARRQALLASLDDSKVGAHYLPVEPTAVSRLSFRPYQVDAAYGSWPSVAELSADSWLLGLNENRGQALIDDDAGALADRMQTYFDSDVALAQLPESLDGLKHPWARFDPEHTRRALLNNSEFDPALVRRFLVRPFDEKWAYCETRAKLWNEARANLVRHAAPSAKYLLARCRAPKALDGSAFMISSCLADQHALHKDAYLIPMTLMSTPDDQAQLFAGQPGPRANVSGDAAAYLHGLRFDAEAEPECGEHLWMHTLATGYAPHYLSENADGIALNWPRIPLPASRDTLLASAGLGRKLAALLDGDDAVAGVTAGSLRHELRLLGRMSTSNGGQLNPSAGELGVTVGWGRAGRAGVTMPGAGKLGERPYSEAELAAFREGLAGLGLTYDQLTACLGGVCYDVYLNDVAYWRCVPARVWKYTIGGYQVMKKWLSYRERALLGRGLQPEEARYVTEMTRRIAAILLLEPALDANYERVKADTYDWSGDVGGV